jgi:glycosyltransferase involved in cell wall biosynthesis
VTTSFQNKGLTVLQIVPELETGGAERTTIEVAQALVQAGDRALVWSAGGRLALELAAVGAIHFQGPAASKNPFDVFLANPAKLTALIADERVNLVHARSRAPAWSGLMAARRAHVPFVTTYHGIYSAKSGIKRWYNSSMVRGDAIIANSHFTKAHIIEEYGSDPDSISVIHRGVDIDGFDPAKVSPERVATLAHKWRLDVSRSRPRIILPARLTQWKGQSVLIEALARLKNNKIAFEAILVGDSQGREVYADSLRTEIHAVGLSRDVFLVGHCSDMPAAFALSDIAVTPSTRPEAFGRTAAEAQAMGLPVVASDLGGARETIDPDITGILVPPSDAIALAQALRTLIEMGPERRASMGAAGFQRIRALFTTQSLQSQTLALYHRIVAERRGE